MEPPGGLPPDRDKYSTIVHQQQQPNISGITIATTSSSTLPGSATTITPSTTNLSSLTSTSTAHAHAQHQPHNLSIIGVSSASQQSLEKLSRPAAFDKMEALVREMQDPETGVPVRQQKMFLTSIPYAFMGYDLIEWLMDRLSIEESEALNIANQLCLHGYFFPVNDTKSLVVKDDSSLYRFQTPYYWPWQHKAPDNVEYAIYLCKRSLRNKQRHGLEDYESEALASLHKNLKGKWDFISMQAEEQVRLAKERKKGDKIVGDSQERAYWRVHRPPPGQFTPLEPCPVPSRDRQGLKSKKRTIEDWQREVDYLKKSLTRTRMKMSQACESLVQYWETFAEYDFFLQPVLPSNPWVSEDTTFWQLNNALVDIPTEKRVKRWSISIEELVSDPTGLQEFTNFLEKEYSHENIRFWIAVNRLRRSAHSQVARNVNDIYEEFLKPGAPCEINIDSKTMEIVQKGLKNPSRFTFDAAAEHIYMLLLKKDCYPRFIRSEHYKSLLASGIQPSHKKRFFVFGGVAKKKSSTAAVSSSSATTQGYLSQASGSGAGNVPPVPGSLTRRRGSDRSLTGSAHELAVIGVKDSTATTSKVPHSHSQSNLSEIPYSVTTVYRGDMPSQEDILEDSPNLAGKQEACSLIITQENTTKPLTEKLETTIEASGASSHAVCPWDMPSTTTTIEEEQIQQVSEATSVMLSVCPWDDNPTTIADDSITVDDGDSQKHKSTLSDISEVSERMRRSCGLRQQNTVEGDYSSKRLMPDINEQRRASMTATPRISEYQTRPPNIQRTTTTPSPTLVSFPETIHQATSKKSIVDIFDQPMVTATSTATITSEENPISAASNDNLPSISSEQQQQHDNTIKQKFDEQCGELLSMNLKSDNSDLLLLKYKDSKNYDNNNENNTNTQTVMQQQQNKEQNNEKSDNLLLLELNLLTKNTQDNDDDNDRDNEKICVTSEDDKNQISSSVIMSQSITPTIHIVNPVGDQDDEDDDDDNNDFRSNQQLPTYSREDIRESISTQTDDEDLGFIRDDDDNDKNNIINIATTTTTTATVTEISCSIAENTLTGIQSTAISTVEEISTEEQPHEGELSPTMEGYQECAQFGDSTDVFDVEANLAPGCVAPAPTPAPSLAPLAEIETDPIDEEQEMSTILIETKIVESAGEETTKRRRKKRDSDGKKHDATEGTSAGTSQKKEGETSRNQVCPWEDEDVSTSDTTFVKTYATLGYL